jgi:hypothetical protein
LGLYSGLRRHSRIKGRSAGDFQAMTCAGEQRAVIRVDLGSDAVGGFGVCRGRCLSDQRRQVPILGVNDIEGTQGLSEAGDGLGVDLRRA